jgi:hypothetical protein
MWHALLLVSLSSVLWSQVPQEPAHIRFFKAVPDTVPRGGTVTIRWSATGVDRVRLEPLGLELPAEGEMNWPVQGRCVFWLNAVNLSGGQSAPLVVDFRPEPIQVQPPQLPPPTAQPPSFQPPQLALAAQARPRHGAAPARHPAQGRAWIQLAVMTSPRYSARLRRRLARLPGIALTPSPWGSQASARREVLRAGPFRSLGAARYRLRLLEPRLAALHLKPLVILDRSAIEPVLLAAR